MNLQSSNPQSLKPWVAAGGREAIRIKARILIPLDAVKVYELDIEHHCRPVPSDVKEAQDEKAINIMFDSETYNNKRGKHIPYLASYVCDTDNSKNTFVGKDCLEQMLTELAEQYGSTRFKEAPEINLFAHNMTYDGSFMLKYLMNLQILEKDNKYVSMKGYCCSKKPWDKSGKPKKFIKVMLKDSWRLIPMKLAKMPSALGFKNTAGKEVMYYDMYNWETIGHITRMTKQEMKTYIKKHDEQSLDSKEKLQEKSEQFFKNLAKWGCVNDDKTYDLQKYSKIYCEADCTVLRLGLTKWRELFRNIDSRIDVYQFYSLPSIAEYYFRINECYKGCYQMNGSLGAFFSELCTRGASDDTT